MFKVKIWWRHRYDQYYEGRMDGPGTQPPYPDHHPVYAVDGNPRIRPEGYVAALSNASIARTDYRVAAVIMNAGQMQSSGLNENTNFIGLRQLLHTIFSL